MRTVTSGTGTDTTAAVKAYLAAGNQFRIPDLYLIGESGDPAALWLTNWESPLLWTIWGTFLPAVIKRSAVDFKVGFDVTQMTITWSPPVGTFTNNIGTTSPYQLAQLGYYDNREVRLWKCFMATAGDANTYGACEWFGGRIANAKVTRGSIEFTVNSWLDVVNENVPTNVIELLNTLAAYKGARPPAGYSVIPQFDVVAPVDTQIIYADCTVPTPHLIFSTNAFQRGFLVFNAGGTLDGVFSAILQNYQEVIGGTNYSGFQLYTPLPWAPTPGVDTFYVSAANPINQADGDYYGFPYVPDPEQGI